MTDKTYRTLYAAQFAAEKHRRQIDKAGQPYIEHVLRVAVGVSRYPGSPTGTRVIAALLHDVLEDTETTRKDLIGAGFSHHVVNLVDRLTRRRDTSYMEYIEHLTWDQNAVIIKLCDIADNSNPERLRLLEPETAERLIQKYAQARELLRGWA